jgi:phosphosulfolactate synthase
MNYTLKNLPERTKKPRQTGFTMAMDKGLSVREAEDFMSIAADHVDIVKLGWGTSKFIKRQDYPATLEERYLKHL